MWSKCDKRIRTLLCFIVSISTLCSGYVITTPRRWTAGEESQVCVILSASPTAEESITFELRETETSLSKEKKILIPETNVVVPQGTQSICKNIALPPTEKNQGQFTILGSLEEKTINYTKTVTIATDVAQTFVQSDKYLYKPSQTVQFRILTVIGPYLKVSVETYEEVFIESPSGTRLAQWLDVANDNGLIHLSFQLSDEPEEGEYQIKVRTKSGKTYKRSFKVEEYVLPRYEVTIKPPKYVLGTTEVITFKVCAKYTFGQPVKGNVSLSVDNNGWGSYKITVKKEDKISGCKSFNVTAEELSINGKEYFAYSLRANAIVTEEGTGVELKAAESSVDISRTALSFEDISVQKYFKPELPYVGEVKVTFPDDSPAIEELLTVCCDESCKNLTTNANGILKFAVPPHLDERISIKAPNYPRKTVGDSWRSIMYESSFHKTVKKYHSPSNSSLIISLSNDELQCTPTVDSIDFELPVMFSSLQQETASVTVQVVSRGQIQFSKTTEQALSAGSTLTIPDSLFIEPVREPTTKGLVRGHFTVAISLPKTVSPEAQIIVWYARDDGEVVSDSRDLSIMECLLNSVNIAWSTDKAQPGAPASVSITAEPLSLCSLGVVDKSVQLLSAKKNSLTIKTLLDLAKRASVSEYEHQQVDDFEYCKKKQPDQPEPEPPLPPVVLPALAREKREALSSKMSSGSVQRSKRSLIWPWPYYSDDVDALYMFDDAGLYVLTDLTLESRPCRRRYVPTLFYGYSGPMRPAPPAPPPGRDFIRSSNRRPVSGLSGIKNLPGPVLMNEVPQVFRPMSSFDDGNQMNKKHEDETSQKRIHFPETWIWEFVDLTNDGVSEEALTLPDTVTEWVGSAVCVHPSKGVGISNTASIITFKEFFVDLTLPPTVKRGEIFPVKISIFNYLKESLPIRVILESPDANFDILADTGETIGSGERTSCVPAEDKTVIPIRIKAREVGDVNISVKAIVEANSVSECGSGTVQQTNDHLIKPIRVIYEGFLKEEAQSKYVCTQDLENSEDVLETWNVKAPASIVQDSARGFVAVVGDLMGPTLENLGSLIKMPYGCGEQNMLNFAPNIFVMQYLDASNQNTPNIANKAVEFMEKGYQRELNYRHRDGSFSAFGESDDSGSTWLTAFVLKSFAQSRTYISIDVKDLTISKDWLKSKQLENGCFESVGKVLHKGMKGGLSGTDSPSLLTSFVLISLIEAGETASSTAISEALFCINAAEPTTNPYSLAVRAYALALANSPDTQAALDQLLKLAKTSAGALYWELPSQYESSKGVAVETASYAVLALLAFVPPSAESTVDYLPQVRLIIKWINTQRNGQGGFISTQDTIIALQALAAFEKTVSQGPIDLTVLATVGNVEESITVNEKNKLLQQTVAFPSVPTSITFDIVGQGCVLLQSVLRYNVPEPEGSEAFSLRVTTKTEPDKGCKTKRIEVCSSYLLPDKKSNMAIFEINLVSGYIPEKADLKQIIGYGGGLYKKYEVDGIKVQIYVDEFSPEEICVSFRILREADVENPKPGTIKVYDYYKPEYQVSETYTLPPMTECVDEGEVFPSFEGEIINAVEGGEQQPPEVTTVNLGDALAAFDEAIV